MSRERSWGPVSTFWLTSVGGFCRQLQRMYAPVFHRHLKGLIDHPMAIEQIFSFEQIGDHSNGEVVHRARLIPNSDLGVGE
jgi:hypothetical protein